MLLKLNKGEAFHCLQTAKEAFWRSLNSQTQVHQILVACYKLLLADQSLILAGKLKNVSFQLFISEFVDHLAAFGVSLS